MIQPLRHVLSLFSIVVGVFTVFAFVPAAAEAQSRPAPPCTAPPLPEPVATRFAQLGGVERFGCAEDVSGPVYIFRAGRIEAIPTYGPNATYAAIVDSQSIVHLYVSGTNPTLPVDDWLVRLTYDGSLVNQVQYTSGDGDVGDTWASNILVHPGGRHGTFEIALEGCYTALALGIRNCLGWSNAVFRMDL